MKYRSVRLFPVSFKAKVLEQNLLIAPVTPLQIESSSKSGHGMSSGVSFFGQKLFGEKSLVFADVHKLLH